MVKLLHTADIHLDSPLRSLALRNESLAQKIQSATRSTLEKLIEIARDEGVSALLISGDLYDGEQRSAKTAAFLTEQMDKLREMGIKVYLIKGNHDAENPISGEVSLPDNVVVFDGHGKKVRIPDTDVWIHGVSFKSKHCADSLLAKFQQPEADSINIGLLHTSLSGVAGHDNYAPCSVSELKGMGFDYWALGHIHKRQVHSEDPWIVMPGIPQGRGMDELGLKSASLITVEDGKIDVREVPTSTVEFQQIEIDVSGADSEDAIRDKIRADLVDLSQSLVSEAAILRITLTGQTEQRWQLIRDKDRWEEQISILAENTGRLWLEKLNFDLEDVQMGETDSTSVDELGHMMASIAAEKGFFNGAVEDLDKLVGLLPANLRAELLPEENSMEELAKELLASGAQHMYATLRGGQSNETQ